MMPKTLQPSKGPTDILECFRYAPWNPYNPLLGDLQTPGLCCLESTWVPTAPCFSTNLLTKESSPSNFFRTTRSPNLRSSGISPGNPSDGQPVLTCEISPGPMGIPRRCGPKWICCPPVHNVGHTHFSLPTLPPVSPSGLNITSILLTINSYAIP